MKSRTLFSAALAAVLSAGAANAEIILNNDQVQFFATVPPPLVLDLTGGVTLPGDYALPESGFVRLKHQYGGSCSALVDEEFSADACLEVRNGSTLQSALGLYTTVFNPAFKSGIFVDGAGSTIEIGSASGGEGNIRLNGKGDFDITSGATVRWANTQNCNGDFFTCDILIGATAASNTGIRVIGTGSLLDASNTSGRLFVGYVPSAVAYSSDPAVEDDSEDFFVVAGGGTARSDGAGIGKGYEGPGVWDETVGFVQGTAFVDNGSWFIQGAPGTDSILNIGEGDGGSGNVIVTGGGLIDITGNVDNEAAFFLGQTLDGTPTQGGSNLAVIDGTGSTVNVDNNAGVVSGSRIANGFVTVQNGGSLQLDSSILVISGNSGATLSAFNIDLALNAAGISGLENINLDVLSGGLVSLTDEDGDGFSALVIGQTPDAGPVQTASVRVDGAGSAITVSNDPTLPKIPLTATAFGIPSVSNIGTGSLTIENDGLVSINNGDFVIAARDGDFAAVTVSAASFAADRVIVGLTDFEAASVVPGGSTGVLTLASGTVDGDVVVDDNGILNGVGNINGTLFMEGGLAAPGFSPGTIVVESMVLAAGSNLIMELALNADGSVNTAQSDSIVANGGSIDLSGGSVTFALSSADPAISVAEIVAGSEVLAVADVFQSEEGVAVADFELTDTSGSISDQDLEQQVVLVSFTKLDCKNGGWESLTRPDGSSFANQGLCIKYALTGE